MENGNKATRYKICQILGEGATSTVYRAIDTIENKVVAIKVFSNRNLNFPQKEISIKIKNECKILQCIESEHIVKLEQYIHPNTLILEHCDNNLISFLNEHELDLKGIKKIIRMILLGVHEIHSKNIIHRDLKLGNILLKEDCVKICDFGLSCFQEENDFSYCGTKDYLAPEIAILEKEPRCMSRYDNKIDIYAVGVIYKTLLFRRKNVDISEIDIRDDIKDLIVKMGNVSPEKRPNAYEALCHRSFNDLFKDVPDFRLLKDYSKETRYGKVFKFSKFFSSKGECKQGIGINFGENSKTHTLQVIADNKEPFTFFTILNGKSIDIKLMNSTILKHFNYLVSYFKIISDKTIQFELSEGIYRYYRTVSNIEVLECSDFKVTKQHEKYEITYFKGTENEDNSKVSYKAGNVPPAIEILFKNFENRHLINKSALSIDQQTNHSIISLTPEHLFKKYQFCTGIGWCIKENFGFTILLNEGTKLGVFVDEFSLTINNSEKISMRNADNKILETIKKFVVKFV